MENSEQKKTDQPEQLTMEVALQNLTATAIVKYDEIIPPPKDGLAKKSFEDTVKEIETYVKGFTIKGPEDTKGYETAKKIKARLVKMRTGIENLRKELKAPALAFGKNVDGEGKRRTTLLEPSEKDIDAKLAVIDKALEIAKNAKTEERKKQLIAAGFALEGTFYIAGKEIILANTIADLSDEKFTEAIDKGKAEAERLIEEHAAAVAKELELQQLRDQVNAGNTTTTTETPAAETTTVGPKRELRWFTERIGKEVRVYSPNNFNGVMKIADNSHAVFLSITGQDKQGYYFEDLTEENKPKGNEVSNGPAPISPLSTPAPQANQQTIKIAGYADGFEECKKEVLKIMNSHEKMQRAAMIDLINKLKPLGGAPMY